MAGAIAHRGPDGEGFFVGRGVGLAHRRLSIIDLAGGGQPIGNEDGSIQVVFNGEIYNYLSLRRDLQARGHSFRTLSDTEVLVHLYEEEGEGLVDRLRGMFAFALWDEARSRLLLARDRSGIKPLYINRGHDVFLFGSEVKAILAAPGVRRDVDPEALEDYLAFGVVPGPRSIFLGIEKLPPAHVLVVGPDDWHNAPRRYWSLRFEPDPNPTASEWGELIRAKLAESVESHLLADVPVGAFLSGGVDSAAVVAMAAGRAPGRLRTFSIGFDEDDYNELPHARAIAKAFGTEHVEEVVRPDAVGLLDELSDFYDEPFADASALPTYLISRLTAREVKVVLSGDGGDEAFGGYARYAHDLREAEIRRRLPAWFRRAALGPLGRAWPKADRLPRPLRAKTRLTNLALDPADAYVNTLMTCREPLRRRLLHPDIGATLNGHDPAVTVREAFTGVTVDDLLTGMISADVAMMLPDDFLVKVDRASMAHGLEVRPPLLDHEILELAAAIPSGLKVRGGDTKWVFKQALRGTLPAATLDRPKRGFDVPIDAWLRGPLRPMFEDCVLGPRSAIDGLIDRRTARALRDAHDSGASRQGSTLWGLLVLSRWADRYLG